MRFRSKENIMMQIKGSTMTRQILLVSALALVLGSAPAFAKDEFPSSDATGTPIPVSTKGDNVSQSMGDMSSPSLDQSMPADASSGASDSLSNFGPSSGTVV